MALLSLLAGASGKVTVPSENLALDVDPFVASRFTLVSNNVDAYAYTGAAGALTLAPTNSTTRIPRSTAVLLNGRPSLTLSPGKDLFTDQSLGIAANGNHAHFVVFDHTADPAANTVGGLTVVGQNAGAKTASYVGLTNTTQVDWCVGAGSFGNIKKLFVDTGYMVAFGGWNGTNFKQFVDGRLVQTSSTFSLLLSTGGGFRAADAITTQLSAAVFRALIYSDYPDRTKRTRILKALRKIYAIPNKAPRVLASGTSITAGVQGAVGGYVTLLATDLGVVDTTSEINFGISGATTGLTGGTGGLLALYHGHTDDWYTPLAGGHDCCIVEGGANDQAAGYTTQDTIDNMFARCDGLRAIGWKAILLGVPPGDGDSSLASFQTYANTVNTALRANWQSHADAFADPDTVPELGTPAGHAGSGDHLHFGAHGDGLLKDLIKPFAQTLMGL